MRRGRPREVGGIAAVGTKLYCAPCHASSILVIDSETEVVHTVACGVGGKYKWVALRLWAPSSIARRITHRRSLSSTVRRRRCTRLHAAWTAKTNGWHRGGGHQALLRAVSRIVDPRIDSETEAVRTIACGVGGKYKWYGIAAVGTKSIVRRMSIVRAVA